MSEKKFIILDDVRVRISNIKNYGISSKKRPYEKIYTKKEYRRSGLSKILLGEKGWTLEWEGELNLIDEERYEDIGKVNKNASPSSFYPEGCCETYKLYKEKGSKEIFTSNQYSTIEDSVVFKQDKYLYITTFQRDNYTFFENDVGFNIFDKCRELDELVSGELGK